MLLTLVEALSCENPQCRQFARIVPRDCGRKSYYCQICGRISSARIVDAAVLSSPERYAEFLRGTDKSAREPVLV